MDNNRNSFRRADIPTEYNYRSNTFTSLNARRSINPRYSRIRNKKSKRPFYGFIAFLVILGLFIYSWLPDKNDDQQVLSLTSSPTKSFNINAEAEDNTVDQTPQPFSGEIPKLLFKKAIDLLNS